MRLWRAHCLGNDYLVLESGEPVDASLAKRVCDRHRGVGSDGLLEPVPAARAADFGVRIWNPDGSIAEKSGNGLRIFAHWLVHERGGAGSTPTLDTGADRAACTVDGDNVAVSMGRARFAPADVPVRADGPLLDAPLEVGSTTLRVVAVGVGNPHCVVYRPEPLDDLPWRAWGAALERHERFPNRTNVQFARVIRRDEVEIRIWERGAGPTLASGSSACAVVAAGVETGRLDAGSVTVHMEGGPLTVWIDEGRELRIRGPVTVVGRVHVDARWLNAST